jgi:hypothetical protein
MGVRIYQLLFDSCRITEQISPSQLYVILLIVTYTDAHELYSARHLFEDFMTNYQLTGDTFFLNTILRFVTQIKLLSEAERINDSDNPS